MTQAPSAAPPQPKAEGPSEETGLRARLRRRLSRLVPRTRKQQALYALIFLLLLIALFEWRSSTSYSAFVTVTAEKDQTIVLSPPGAQLFDFGQLPQGGSGTVNLILQNEGAIPTRFFIVPVGSIRQFIKLDEAFVLLQPGEAQVVQVSAVVPRTANTGEYSGRVVVIRTPWLPWP
jgi:hypothetical protein